MKKIPDNKNAVIVHKDVGETPLEALERYRAREVAAGRTELANAPMTYAGRLDPMAEGELLILIGDECRNKERWLGLDKEYEVEIVLGIETDTYDALGLAKVGDSFKNSMNLPHRLGQYTGRLRQEYPPYSSKMFNWKGNEPPTKEVEIYSIGLLSENKIHAAELKDRIFSMIDKVKGEFRQTEIKQHWSDVLKEGDSFETMKIRVKCSSGTYMRSLAHRMGGFALKIMRTAVIDK